MSRGGAPARLPVRWRRRRVGRFAAKADMPAILQFSISEAALCLKQVIETRPGPQIFCILAVLAGCASPTPTPAPTPNQFATEAQAQPADDHIAVKYFPLYRGAALRLAVEGRFSEAASSAKFTAGRYRTGSQYEALARIDAGLAYAAAGRGQEAQTMFRWCADDSPSMASVCKGFAASALSGAATPEFVKRRAASEIDVLPLDAQLSEGQRRSRQEASLQLMQALNSGSGPVPVGK